MANRYMEIKDKIADLRADSVALEVASKGREMTPEEAAQADRIVADFDSLTPQLEREEKRRALELSAPAIEEKVTAGGNRAADQPFANFGEQLQAIRRAKLTPSSSGLDQERLINAAAQGAGEAVDSDGGYLVQPNFATEILRNLFAMSSIAARVRKITIGLGHNSLTFNAINETSRATGSRWGGVQGYWIDEGGTITPSRPKFRRVELKLKKLACFGYASDELLDDATAMSGIMTQAFAEELAFLVDDAIIEGSGSGQPLGFLNSGAVVSQAKETGQAAGTIVFQNILNMWARLYGRGRANAVWLINQSCEPQLYQMSLAVGTGGVPVYLPANGISGSQYATLFGAPVVPIEQCAALGTVGDIILVDPNQYVLIDQDGVEQAQSMHVAFATDEMAFRATYRLDGQLTWNSAVTPFKDTSKTQSCVITLATRS